MDGKTWEKVVEVLASALRKMKVNCCLLGFLMGLARWWVFVSSGGWDLAHFNFNVVCCRA